VLKISILSLNFPKIRGFNPNFAFLDANFPTRRAEDSLKFRP